MKLVAIGKIIKPQGIKGEVKVYLYADKPKFLKNTKHFFTENKQEKFKAETVSIRNNFAFILFEKISSKTEAELLRGMELFVNKEEFESYKEGTFLIEDLLNIKIYNLENKELGTLIEIEKYGSADVWTYRAQGRSYSFPYIESIVKSVDVKNKKIVVDEEKLKEARV